MADDKLAQDEAQRTANYEAVKSTAAGEVVSKAGRARPSETGEVEGVASEMKQEASHEIAETDREIGRGRVVARVSQVVDYIFFIIYGLLSIRLLLELFAARENAGFFKFIKWATGALYAPFRGLVPSPNTAEGFTLALPIIVAIVVYILLHLAINGLLRMVAHRKTEI